MNVRLARCTPFLLTAIVATPFAAKADITVRENHQAIVRTCTANEAVSVQGNANNLQLSGPCGAVTVAGNANNVVLEEARSISTPGNNNHVVWSGGSPRVSNAGSHNQLVGNHSVSSSSARSGAHVGKGVVSDGAGNSVRTNPDGSTTITDAAGNTVHTRPQ